MFQRNVSALQGFITLAQTSGRFFSHLIPGRANLSNQSSCFFNRPGSIDHMCDIRKACQVRTSHALRSSKSRLRKIINEMSEGRVPVQPTAQTIRRSVLKCLEWPPRPDYPVAPNKQEFLIFLVIMNGPCSFHCCFGQPKCDFRNTTRRKTNDQERQQWFPARTAKPSCSGIPETEETTKTFIPTGGVRCGSRSSKE